MRDGAGSLSSSAKSLLLRHVTHLRAAPLILSCSSPPPAAAEPEAPRGRLVRPSPPPAADDAEAGQAACSRCARRHRSIVPLTAVSSVPAMDRKYVYI
ncbi:hypothetical protein EVAR_69319_1 [Eumeta japonica]|uniref:Uncharacterized protein n=1 Tax=Eumeta variegata TaxID=151549 RepID=A0A4C2A4J7_EUMVA|nr:hypothetical protein EVAR_69319_1 [Eumeta japonica]